VELSTPEKFSFDTTGRIFVRNEHPFILSVEKAFLLINTQCLIQIITYLPVL